MKPTHPRSSFAPLPDATTPVMAAATSTSPAERQQRYSKMDTQYVDMLLAMEYIPMTHKLLAAFFNWIYLAGFMLFPGTLMSMNLNFRIWYTSFYTHSERYTSILTLTPFFPPYLRRFTVAWVCVGIGASGKLCLWWRWRKNYIWALNKIWMYVVSTLSPPPDSN